MSLKERLHQLYGVESAGSDLRQRLEKLQRSSHPPATSAPFPASIDRTDPADRTDPSYEYPPTIEQFLGGCWKKNRYGRLVVIERNYPDFHGIGNYTLEETYRVDGRKVALLSGDPSLADFDLQQALFFDTETTGLAGGAGTCAFLIGTGFFVGSDFRTVQFFLPDFESEHAFLTEFADLICGSADRCFRYLVSFNGKSFDAPLIENRYILQRLENPCTGLSHLDLLHPCRSLWKNRIQDCSLQSLERNLMGHVRVGDILSALIPSTYFNFLHWGEFGGLRQVIDHNREDVLSMPVLLGLACRCVEEGFRPEEPEPVAVGPIPKSDSPIEDLDRLSAARLYVRRGCLHQAASLLQLILQSDDISESFRVDVVLELIRVRRRLGEYQAALKFCEELIATCAAPPLEAFQHAAKILEHRERRFEHALRLVLQATELYPDTEDLQRRQKRLENRLARG